MKWQKTNLLWLIFAALLGCHGPDSGASSVKIIGGWNGGSGPTVRQLGNCSMVKVSPTKYLTAAHCFYDAQSGKLQDYYTHAGNSMRIVGTDEGRIEDAQEVHIKSVAIHPTFASECSEGSCASTDYLPLQSHDVLDIAILEIQETNDVPIAKVSYDPVAINTDLRIEGYGCDQGVSRGGTLRKRSGHTWATGIWDLPKEGAEPLTTPEALNASYLLSKGVPLGGTSICPGDSGGPVYLDRASEPTVVGINAYYSFDKVKDGKVNVARINWHTRLSTTGPRGAAAWLQSLLAPKAFDWQNASDDDLCKKEIEIAEVHNWISDSQASLYLALNQAPHYRGGARSNDIASWDACDLVAQQLRQIWANGAGGQ